jgi:hypothetical protein
MLNEVWKDIPNYDGRYQTSNLGNIRNKLFVMKKNIGYRGYEQIKLTKNGISHNHKVHRLVAQAFIPNLNNLPQINHINGIKTDNRVENLEWCTNSYNQLEANRMGFCKNRIAQAIKARSKRIGQFDLNGNLIKEYYNSRIAEKATGITFKNISQAATGNSKTAGGYVWKFL